jgi:hypothetical protein
MEQDHLVIVFLIYTKQYAIYREYSKWRYTVKLVKIEQQKSDPIRELRPFKIANGKIGEENLSQKQCDFVCY